MGHIESKSRSLGQILEKPCVRARGHIFSLIILKLGQNVCLDEISDEFENGSCQSKARSLGQILEKPCVRSRGHIFSPIILKLGQNVFLDETSDEFENGSCQVKNKVTKSNLRKTLCTLYRQHFQPDCYELVRMFVLIKSQMTSKMGHVG